MAGDALATAYLELIPSMQGSERAITEQLIPQANDAAGKAGESAGGLFGDKFAGVMAAGAIGAGVVAGFQGLYQIGSIFDEVSDTIRVGTGATGAALTGLEDVAKSVATTVPASFESAGQTVADLNTRLGLTGDELETVASQYLEAGRMLGEEIDIQATTAAFSAFGIEGQAVSGAMDSLFQVSQATGVSMNELASSVQAQAPALQQLGFSYEDSIAMLGGLDKAGLNASAVMSGLGRGLVNLAKDGEEPQAAFQRITGEIESLVASGDKAGAIDLASGIFGTKGATQFVSAVESGNLALGDLMGNLGASGDTILATGKETMDFAESWQLLKNNALSALEPLGSAVFAGLGTAMGSVVEAMQGMDMSPLAAIGEQLGTGLGDTLASLGTNIMPVVSAVAQLLGAVNPLGLVLSIMQPLLENLLPPIAELGAGLATGLAPAFSALGPVVGSLAGSLGGVLGTALGAIVPVIVEVASILGPIIGDTLTALQPSIESLGTAFGSLVQAVAPLVSAVLPLLEPLLGLIPSLLSPVIAIIGALVPALDPIILVVTEVATALSGSLESAISAVSPYLSNLGTIFSTIGEAAGPLIEALLPAFSSVLGAIGPIISSVFGLVGPIVEAIMPLATAVLPIVTSLLQIAAPILTLLVGLLAPILQLVLGLVTPLLDIAVGVLQNVLVPVLQFLVPILTTIVGWIAGFIGWIAQLITGQVDLGAQIGEIWNGIMGAIGAAFQWIIDTAVSWGAQIGAWWGNLWNSVWNFVESTWNGIVTGITMWVMGIYYQILSFGAQVIATWNGLWSHVTGFVQSTWDGITNRISMGVQLAIDIVGGLPGKILGFFEGIGSWLVDSGKSLIQGFIDGITAMGDSIGTAVNDLLGGVADFFPHSPAKKGPFSGSGYTTHSGRALAADFAAGILSEEQQVVQAAEAITAAAAINGLAGVQPIGVNGGLAATAAGARSEIHVHASEGMSEATLAQKTADVIDWRAGAWT